MSARSSFWDISPLTQAPINTTSSAFTLIVGMPNKRVKVFRMKLIVNAATTLEVLDGAGILDVLVFPTPGAMVLDFSSIDMPAWYQTSPGNSLNMTNLAGVQLSGNVDYLISGPN